MMKTAGLKSTYSSLSCCLCSHSLSTSPHTLPPQRARPFSSSRRKDVTLNSASYLRDNINWPCPRTPKTKPTPYEIFDISKSATYSKHKYYELVKIYHPDASQHHPALANLQPIEKLERYRLVVQAHEILSDPIKRREYDSHGAGWGEQGRTLTRHSRGYYSPASGKTYGFGYNDDNSPFGNATWEDWEKWYRRADESTHKKQDYAGTYVNPNMFATFVILMAVLSGIAQATRAGQYSGGLEERVQALTAETRQFLNDREQHYKENNLSKADDRVKHFLEKRDPSRNGLKDEEQDAYRKHFSGKGIKPSERATPLQIPGPRTEPPD
jgi:curved DNA-binding protein CbpA